MQERIQKYFRIGTISAVSFPLVKPADIIKKLAADDFFDFIEFEHISCSDDIPHIRRFLAQGHLSASYSAHWVVLAKKMNPNDLDEERRKEAETALLEALEEASVLSAAHFTFLAGRFSVGQEEKGLIQLEKTVSAVCRQAAALGIQVELELFDYDLDKCSLLGPAPLAAAFAARMREQVSNFGLMADLSHFPATRENARFILRTLRSYLTHFHMGNIIVEPGLPAYGDLHPHFGFPHSVNDVAELAEFLSLLREEGFFCEEHPYPLTFEVRPQADEDPEIVLSNAKRTLQRAWSLLKD